MSGTLRFRDLNKAPAGRPTCFGKEFDDTSYECRYSCSHSSACGPVFRARHGKGVSNVPAGLPQEEEMPAVQEIDSEEETFFNKLAYNTGIQTLDALIRELHYAVRSVPRKRYFPQRDR